MSTVQSLRSSRERPSPVDTRHPWWRVFLLSALLLLSVALYLRLGMLSIPQDSFINPFLYTWMICFLPYLAACALVLLTHPRTDFWHWVELGIILGGALIFRAMLLPQIPSLSHDSWRYIWDARITLHGYSPYVYPPASNVLKPLRDSLIYGNTGFRDAPSIYPPAAEDIYVLGYLLAPSNLTALKAIFVGFDMVTCGALVLLLIRRGLDPRRVVLYAWCPLPIVEFAIEGHVDATTITFTVLAILCATSMRRSMRVLAGLFIALATLTKLYPLLLLVVVLRRRDWALLTTCFVTIILFYIPYLILGHGQVLGFFFTYAGQQRQNGGVVQEIIHWITYGHLGLPDRITILIEYCIDLIFVGAIVALVLRQRLRERMSMEMATLVLTGMVYNVSSHIFPWYNPALLVWVVMLISPLWTRAGPSGKGIAIVAVWYFVCTCLLSYFFSNTLDWTFYYQVVYDVVVAGLMVAAVVGIIHMRNRAGNSKGNAVG